MMNMTIGFRNPFKFWGQWLAPKLYHRLIWFFYFWSRNDCDVWIKRGIRIFGIEIEHTQWLGH